MTAIDSKLNILVCESDSRILFRLDSWIKAMGNDVITCSDGVMALEIVKENKLDIILLSQDLNSMGSIEFLKALKEINPSQAVILMLNADADSNFFKSAIDLQVDKYLNKPIDATPLFNAVEALSEEKLWHSEYKSQKRVLQDYKDAIDLSFSVSKHDTDGNVLYANDLFCTTTGFRHADVIAGIINPLQNPNEDMEVVWDALHTDYIYRDRQIFKFDNEQDHILDVTAVAMFDENEEIYEYLVFSNDVSEILYASRKIKEQTHEMDKIKDSFLTVFTHELKTPLNSIINFSSYVEKHLLKEDFPKKDRLVSQVSQINSSGWDMLDMITNLIDSVKLRDNEVTLNYSSFSLPFVVDELLKKYTNSLSEIKIIKLYKDEVELYSDQERVSQVLSSLISNAIKYTNSKIAIILKLQGENFTLEILDDGDGFKDTSKVLDLFSQSDEDNMTRTAQGIGTGLYIVKKLCDIMGYKVHLDKSKNLGGARVVVSGKVKDKK